MSYKLYKDFNKFVQRLSIITLLLSGLMIVVGFIYPAYVYFVIGKVLRIDFLIEYILVVFILLLFSVSIFTDLDNS